MACPAGEAADSRPKWSMGILHDKETTDVPGSVLLLAGPRNEPLGLDQTPRTRTRSSMPEQPLDPKKRTKDGTIILDPQPEDSENDPLNWPTWRRDLALLSIGLYCMVGGGLTPILAAGFTDVAEEYDVEVESVALTTGLYMAGLGLGAVVLTPTAILYGKRPVYLASAIGFMAMSVWCAASPSFASLVVARILQGVFVSPVECLPSATIAEIFFLHERAFRIGIYTLLLLGGKNLVPLVSAAVIGKLGWRWVFWIVTMVVAFCMVLLFFFVPETFWDRTPIPRSRRSSRRPSFIRRGSSMRTGIPSVNVQPATAAIPESPEAALEKADKEEVEYGSESGPVSKRADAASVTGDNPRHGGKELHVGFAPSVDLKGESAGEPSSSATDKPQEGNTKGLGSPDMSSDPIAPFTPRLLSPEGGSGPAAPTPTLRNFNSPSYTSHQGVNDYFTHPVPEVSPAPPSDLEKQAETSPVDLNQIRPSHLHIPPKQQQYTQNLRHQPAKTFTEHLRMYNGRLSQAKWHRVALRPFILFAYPAVLWSAVMYACSVGWLIVLSESMAMIYRDPDLYNFSALQTGLVYISPFIGGILGTGVAGRLSDVIVRTMARRNGGLYEPEFRLVMAIPILITTCIGLMGFGWSVENRNSWIVPTVFFGVVSFGCSLGSTTSITFCVDSYKQYAGEALVTLNFTKNIFHGLVFSIFFTHWLSDDGPKMVFIWIGIIQLVCTLTMIPMYIYGKRARMWTVRKNFVERA